MKKNKIDIEDLSVGDFVLLDDCVLNIAEVPIGIIIFVYYDDSYSVDKLLVAVLGDLDNFDEHCREVIITRDNINQLVKKVYPQECNYDFILRKF